MQSRKSISKLISILFALTTFISIETVNAQEVTMGDFSGQWNTKATSGIAVRTTQRNCLLVSGREVAASPFEAAGSNPALGNGGCAQTYVDTLGNTSSATSIVGVNGDDGNLNFDDGDAIDATQTISSELILSNGSIGLNFSGVTSYNPLLDITTPAFKKLTQAAEDELESKFVLNNAYATFGGVSGDTFVDVTAGRYVESLGTTAFMPIGVNVVNAVDLSILRAPGASIKDALIPQEMLGVSLGTPSGISINGYYQLKQQELVLDPAGAFFGSEVAGTGSTGILKAVNVNEVVNGTTKLYGDAYYNYSTASGGCDLVDGDDAAPTAELFGAHVAGGGSIYTYLLNFSCTREADGTARTALVSGSTDTETQANTYIGAIATHMGTMDAGTVGATLQTVASNIEAGVINATVSGASNHDNLKNNGCKAYGCTDADIINGFTLFSANAPDVSQRRALLNQARAADKEARDDGQFGLNLTGYSEMAGGIDWGLYYSNYHSKIPYQQMLVIRGLNSVDIWSTISDNSTTDWTTADLRADAAQINNNFKYSAEALGYQVLNAVATATTDAAKDALTGLMDTNGVNDAGKAFAVYAIAGKDAAMGAAAASAYAALQPADRSKYQLYYPEDIQVFGASASTVIDGTAVTAEVAYRPDMPLQISGGDQFTNIFDSTGASAMESQGVYLTIIGGAAAATSVSAAAAASAGYSDYDTVQWSGMTDCDITSSGVASTVTGYNECKGHKNLDVWTANATAVKSFNASHPFTNLTGADGSYLLVELGMVHVPDMENTNGVVNSGQFQIGNGYCDGVAGNSATYQNFALFKNGLLGDSFCEANPGASKTASAYKVRSGWNFNNVNNSPWSVSTNVGWDHDFSGNAPSSVGGFTEGKMRLTLGATANKGSVSMNLSYTDQMGDEKDNTSGDKDYVSYSVSYAF
ncbi:DUF1302 domain-containing protein [Pelagibacterales bacterium]|nr:DUF1302 domain-containing protein [Pelagibacterales bacterium]